MWEEAVIVCRPASPDSGTCETNPISGGAEWGAARRTGTVGCCTNEANLGRAGWDGAAGARDAGQMCETNPICGSRQRSGLRRLCKTNPIPGGAGRDGAAGAWDAGQMCETNPISRLRIADWIQRDCRGADQPSPGPVVQTNQIGRSELCETNPNWRGVGRGRPTYQEPIVQNKAKLGQDGTSGGRRIREANCAKRTQFPAGPSGTGLGGRLCETNPISESGPAGGPVVQTNPICRRPDTPPFRSSIIPVFQSDADYAKRSQFAATPRGTGPAGQGAKVQNKPNFGESAGQWNTQHSTILSLHHSSPTATMRNKAKLGQDGTSGGRGAREGPIVQNKANFPRSSPGTDGRGIPFALGRPGHHNLIGP
jgi:hypothetical protein